MTSVHASPLLPTHFNPTRLNSSCKDRRARKTQQTRCKVGGAAAQKRMYRPSRAPYPQSHHQRVDPDSLVWIAWLGLVGQSDVLHPSLLFPIAFAVPIIFLFSVTTLSLEFLTPCLISFLSECFIFNIVTAARF